MNAVTDTRKESVMPVPSTSTNTPDKTIIERPLIATVEDRHRKGFESGSWIWPAPHIQDTNEEGVSAQYYVRELEAGLTYKYGTDAHFVPYVIVDQGGEVIESQPRINKGGLKALRAAGFDVKITCLVADVDNPGHQAWTEELWAEALPKLAQLPANHLWYPSKKGLRILCPSRWTSPEDFERFVWKSWIDEIHGLGFGVDEACKDWTRHYRLPFVIRDGEIQKPSQGKCFWELCELRELPPAPPMPEPVITREPVQLEDTDRDAALMRAEAYVNGIRVPGCSKVGTGEGLCEKQFYAVVRACIQKYGLDDYDSTRLIEDWASGSPHGWTEKHITRAIKNARSGAKEELGHYLTKDNGRNMKADTGPIVGDENMGLSTIDEEAAIEKFLDGDAEVANDSTDSESEATPSEASWRKRLLRKKKGGPVKNVIANVITVLRYAPRWSGCLAWDQFSNTVVWKKEAPWRDNYLASRDVKRHSMWTDEDDIRFVDELNHAGIDVGKQTVIDAVKVVAKEDTTHAVREYLTGIEWDKTPRVERWLSEYMNVEDTEYSRKAGMWWLIQAVARAMDPGCIAKYVLCLEGEQDAGKSTALKLLANGWVMDSELDLRSKEAYMNIQGVWIVELAEGRVFGRANQAELKGFISPTHDRYIPKFENRAIKVPRQCVFALTINESSYLSDPTGAVRYWPVRVESEIDFEKLLRDRDQLWAEALQMYKDGVKPYPQTKEDKILFAEQAEQRRTELPYEVEVRDFVKGKSMVAIQEILDELEIKKDNPRIKAVRQDIINALTTLGWVQFPTVKWHAGKTQRVYVPKDAPKDVEARGVTIAEANALEALRTAGWKEEILPDGRRVMTQCDEDDDLPGVFDFSDSDDELLRNL